MSQRLKIAISCGILLAGLGVAFLFRHPSGNSVPTDLGEGMPANGAAVSAPIRAEAPSSEETSAPRDRSAPASSWLGFGSGFAESSSSRSAAQTTEPSAVPPSPSQPPEALAGGPSAGFLRNSAAPQSGSHDVAIAATTVAAGSSQSTARNNLARANSGRTSVAATSRTQPPVRTHVIRDGDTLSYLAEKYLGRGDRYREIFEYNRDVLTYPDILPIGARLKIPPPSASVPARSPSHAPATGDGLAPIPPGSLQRQR